MRREHLEFIRGLMLSEQVQYTGRQIAPAAQVISALNSEIKALTEKPPKKTDGPDATDNPSPEA